MPWSSSRDCAHSTAESMRICVLDDVYDCPAWEAPLEDWRVDPTPFLKAHNWSVEGLTKETAVSRLNQLSRKGIDLFFNLCAGAWDEESPGIEVVQALERLNLPFTGATSERKGRFEIAVVEKDDEVRLTRRLSVAKERFTAAEWPELRALLVADGQAGSTRERPLGVQSRPSSARWFGGPAQRDRRPDPVALCPGVRSGGRGVRARSEGRDRAADGRGGRAREQRGPPPDEKGLRG